MADFQRIEQSDTFKNELMPGETVIWRGSPGKIQLFSGSTSKVRTWIITIAIFLVVSGAFLWAELAAGAGFNLAFQLLLTLIFLVYFFRPLTDARTVQRSVYFVTDRRVITMPGGNKFFSMNRNGLRVEWTKADDCFDVLLGATVGIPPQKHFRYARVPKRDDREKVNGMVFFHIADDAELRKIL